METPVHLRPSPFGALAGALLALLLVPAARGGEAVTVGEAAVLTIHGPDEVLRDYCVEKDGVLWLMLPGGARFELIVSTDDPAIVNKGDGRFHPFEPSQVRVALASLRAPLAAVQAEVFLLPYPRRSGLESAAAPGMILLSPGVRELSPEHQHAEFVHELGHVVHYTRMPDAAAWTGYRELRGITDAAVYHASAPHADRPQEIFAEDFRALIGGTLANYSGTIENPDLAPPATVAGLDDYMRAIADASHPSMPEPIAAYPNPARAAVTFVLRGGTREPLDVYDLTGRRIAILSPAAAGSAVAWTWDGRDQGGTPAGAGVYFARTRTGTATMRVTRIR
jgi:hypothetical protein